MFHILALILLLSILGFVSQTEAVQLKADAALDDMDMENDYDEDDRCGRGGRRRHPRGRRGGRRRRREG